MDLDDFKWRVRNFKSCGTSSKMLVPICELEQLIAMAERDNVRRLFGDEKNGSEDRRVQVR